MSPDPRENPTSITVNLTTGEGVDITWGDDHQSHYSFAFLRDHCPCASCDTLRQQTSGPTLPLYRTPVKPLKVSPVGFYAIHFDWNDGHATGIYSFSLLRGLCPCVACQPAGPSSQKP